MAGKVFWRYLSSWTTHDGWGAKKPRFKFSRWLMPWAKTHPAAGSLLQGGFFGAASGLFLLIFGLSGGVPLAVIGWMALGMTGWFGLWMYGYNHYVSKHGEPWATESDY